MSFLRKIRGWLVILIAVAIAFVVVSQSARTVPLVVAAADIDENTVLTAELLTVRTVHPHAVLPGMFLESEKNTLLGKISQGFIPKGYPLSKALLVDPAADASYGRGLSARLSSPQQVLFPIKVPNPNVAVAGKIVPGEYVDLFLVINDTMEKEVNRRDVAALFLQHQRVFDYNDQVLTVEVPKEKAVELALVTSGKGQLIVALTRVDGEVRPLGLTATLELLKQRYITPLTAITPITATQTITLTPGAVITTSLPLPTPTPKK